MAVLNQVPGGARLFRHEDGWYGLEYDVPGSTNGAKMYYYFPDVGQFEAIVGVPMDQATPDFEISAYDFGVRSAGGAFIMGTTSELANTTDHPFDAFLADYEKEAAIRPWLKDPEILALTASAVLEGREVTDAELQSTNWWKTRTQEERNWLTLVSGDPASAQRALEDNRRATAEALRAAGIDNAPQAVADLIADKVTRGEWSEAYAAEQIRKLSDPFAAGELDPLIQDAVTGVDLDTTTARMDDVRALAREWLGPMYGEWSDDQVAQWAGRLRNDPDGETALTDHMRGTLRSIFGEERVGKDSNLTYEDIVAPARVLYTNIWGVTADETEGFFIDVAKQTDHAEAARRLRIEGQKRGVKKVVNDTVADMLAGAGSRAIVREDM